MPEIPYSDPETLSQDVLTLMAKLPNYNIFRMLARCEQVFSTFIRFNDAVLNRTLLDPVLREAAIIRVGHRCGAAYEVHHHERIGRTLGMDDATLRALAPGQDLTLLGPRIALVVIAADELCGSPQLSSTTLGRLRDFLSDREVIELVFSIGCYMMVARLLLTCGVEIEPEGANAPLSVRGADR